MIDLMPGFGAFTPAVSGGGTSFLLLADGTSFLLLADGVSKLILA